LDEKALSAEVIVLGGSIRDGAQGGSRIVGKQEARAEQRVVQEG
jgi:hypothetical protein